MKLWEQCTSTKAYPIILDMDVIWLVSLVKNIDIFLKKKANFIPETWSIQQGDYRTLLHIRLKT
jgi:hypothetical protein